MFASPSSRSPLRLGTRRSPLAMAQAREVRERLCTAHGWPAQAVELVPVIAAGDRIQDRALADIGGKALWTRELDQWLDQGRIDAAVHSLKDVETLRPESLAIAAVLPRADKADVLLGAPSIAALPHGAVVGTSAPRRAAQLRHLRPDCRVVTFRGNIATRRGKLAAGEADATFLAAAGLLRLGEGIAGIRLDPLHWMPAPAQGAIGVECRADDQRLLRWLAAIDHAPSREEVMAERALLAALGGSCHSAIACFTQHAGDRLHMAAAIFSADGTIRIAEEHGFAPGDAAGPADLARILLDRAPPQVRIGFAGAV